MEQLGNGRIALDGTTPPQPGPNETACGCGNPASVTALATVGSRSHRPVEGGVPATLEVEFLEVDMPTTGAAGCAACDSVRLRLDEAVAAVRPLLDEVGVDIVVTTGRVRTELEARNAGLRASPTIRFRGLEITPEHRGTGEDRIWTWRGQAFDTPPRALFIDALLRAYAIDPAVIQARESSRGSTEPYELPPYLVQFLSGPEATDAGTSACCAC